MKSRCSRAFWRLDDALSDEVQSRASKAHGLWRENPMHPSLHYKRVDPDLPIYSVRLGKDYRAVGILRDDTMLWFWIGPHAEYDTQLSRRFGFSEEQASYLPQESPEASVKVQPSGNR